MRALQAIFIAMAMSVFCTGQEPSAKPLVPQPTIPVSAAEKSVLMGERQNFKSDLAELRALLNVLASQESGMDMRSSAAMQTNRKMWQVVIARLAEITQRLDAMEQRNGSNSAGPLDPH